MINRLSAAAPADRLEEAAQVLKQAVDSGLVRSAVIVARSGDQTLERAFGQATLESPFLLGSISKPIAMGALLKLLDQGELRLEDPAQKYLPEFRGDGREQVTVQHLLTHVSGLPDQLPDNAELRKNHAPLSEFVRGATRVPLGFKPGTQFEYSSMAIMLAAEIAQRIAQQDILTLVQKTVLDPLGMSRSAIGLGKLALEETVPMQIEHAAPEAGGGDPTAKDWDWNSPYWRKLGAPWGGVHASAADVLKFLDAFVSSPPNFLSADTAELAIRNHNGGVRVPRGLAFALGPLTLGPGVSEQTFGHTGSTGTIAWRDPASTAACVVLTGLPARAVKPHPRDLAAACVSRK